MALATALALGASLPASAGDPTPGSGGELFAPTAGGSLTPAVAPTPTVGFTDSVVISGMLHPTAVRFADDGRTVVALKDGRVLVFTTFGAVPVQAVDLRTAVHDYWDRGLLGLALDPDFTTNGRIYVAYTYDHILGSAAAPPRWGDTCPDPPQGTTDGCVVSARISAFTLTANVAGSEQVLVEDWCQQFPSHSIGALEFGPDGYLYASGGDGASFNGVDYGQRGGTLPGTPTPANPCGDPPNGYGVANTSPSGRGGALRSQSLLRPPGEPVNLNGSIIRIDPATGAGAPGNPLAGSADANAARLVAYGFRNPFRFTFRPGSAEIWVGDVGWEEWEEIDKVADPVGSPIENFGWPCYEGPDVHPGFVGLTQCNDLASGSRVEPFLAYDHSSAVVSGDGCSTTNGSSVTGIAFYQGGDYPAKYDDALFFADHSRDCIWAMLATAGLPDTSKVELLVGAAANPVDLQIGPAGDLFYVDHEGGAIHRLAWTAANNPPSAVMSATPTTGTAPLDVDFDATGSSDPDGDAITYAWDFTDNGSVDATTLMTSHQYGTSGVYTARLTVTDSHGATSSVTRQILVDRAPPSATITAPTTALTWHVGESIAFAGSGADGDGAALPAAALTWTYEILHCTAPGSCHSHLIETRTGVSSGTITAEDHEWPSAIVIGLTVSDGELSTSTSVTLDPEIVDLAFEASPVGAQLVINGEAHSGSSAEPIIRRTVIVNSQIDLSVISPQVVSGIERTFSSWSDDSANPNRTIIAPASPWSDPLEATFKSTSADLWLKHSGVRSSSGNTIRWKVVAVNRQGGKKATSVKVKIDLPNRVGRPTSISASGWSCAYRSGKHRLVCTRSSLAAGARAKVWYTTTILKHRHRGYSTARVSSATRDVTSANNVVTTSVFLE